MKEHILNQFSIEGEIGVVLPFGSGHINDSYRVSNRIKSQPDYLLQRINHHVFKDVEGMMQNIDAVTSFLRQKYIQEGQDDIEDRVLVLVHTRRDQLFVKEGENYWRLFHFIKGLKSLDVPQSTAQVYEGARAFGQFVADLASFDASGLISTIPFFHHMPNRLKIFEQVMARYGQSLAPEEQMEVDFIREQSAAMCGLQHLLDSGGLPLRVTHNDTKFNNVLLDQHNKAKCVIDLDTVMPGLIHFDFGDGVRTGASTTVEDEQDLEKVDVDMELFEAFTHGYLDATRDILTVDEIDSLPQSTALMSFIMGVRFITDHFDGNKYYKIAFSNHNLVRARCQLQLCRQMIKRSKDFASIVNKYV